MRLLLFEDDCETAARLIAKVAEAAEPNQQIEVVWFYVPFNRPPGRTIFPASVEIGCDEPWKIQIANKRIGAFVRGDRSWWQCQFHAAILDVYMEPNRPIGDDYLKWLNDADFFGYVATITQRPDSVFRARGINRDHFFKEDSGNPDSMPWMSQAIENAINRAATDLRPWQVVNYRGRDPSSFVDGFYAENPVPESRSWHCTFFGTDVSLATDLARFFCMPLDDGRPTSFGELATIHMHPERNRRRVAWIDCGEDLSDDFAEYLIRLLGRIQPCYPCPVSFLLADRDALTHNTLRDKLSEFNAVIAPRSKLRTDAGRCAWLAESTVALAEEYEHANNLTLLAKAHPKVERYQENLRMAYTHIVRKLPIPFTVARAMNRLSGARGSDVPSLADWTSRYCGETLNKVFPNDFRTMSLALKRAARISDFQFQLCEPKTRDESGEQG